MTDREKIRLFMFVLMKEYNRVAFGMTAPFICHAVHMFLNPDKKPTKESAEHISKLVFDILKTGRKLHSVHNCGMVDALVFLPYSVAVERWYAGQSVPLGSLRLHDKFSECLIPAAEKSSVDMVLNGTPSRSRYPNRWIEPTIAERHMIATAIARMVERCHK